MVQHTMIEGFRVIQIIQDKAETAGNGGPFTRSGAPNSIIWIAPFGRVDSPSSTALRILKKEQLFPAKHALGPMASQLTESINHSVLDYSLA